MFKGQVCLSACFSFLGKIEVKILTRKNADEAGDQWLTEEDTKSFRELLISLLVTEEVTVFSFTVTVGTVELCSPANVCWRVCSGNKFQCENAEGCCCAKHKFNILLKR